MSQATGTGKPVASPVWALPVTIACMLAVPVLCLGAAFGVAQFLPAGDPPFRLAAPAEQQAAATVSELNRAAKAQGVCYGWRLYAEHPGKQPVSVGSSAGVGVSVRTAPGCVRWLEVEGHTSPTSRRTKVVLNLAQDTGNIAGDGRPISAGLRLGSIGVTEEVFLADTGAGILRAAQALPLIAADEGIAGPLSARAAGSPEARPLPALGNDFWRDRSGTVGLGSALLALGAAGAATKVLVYRRRRRG